MAFLNPWMLLGVGAVAIPVCFHLMRRKQAVPKRWAAFRLLVQTQAAARRARVEHWLLLALRIAVVLLLVIAFARPGGYLGLLERAGAQGKHVVVVLDTSYSMGFQVNDVPKFKLARERVLAHLDRLAMGRGAVLLASDRPREPFAGFTGDPAVVREAVERAELSAGGTDGNAALRRAVALLREAEAEERVVFFYSDFQRNAWDLADLAKLNEEAKGLDLRIALVHLRGEGGEEDNQAVASAEVLADVVAPEQTAPQRVAFLNFHREKRERSFALWVDGRKRHEQQVEIPAAEAGGPGRAEATIPLVFPDEGYHSGQVTLEPDCLEVDNTRWFALQVVPRLCVLLVDGDPQLDAARSETFFLANLLRPDVSKNIDPTVVPVWDLPKTDVSKADVVVLANVNEVAPETFSALRDFVQKGGGLVYFPGDKVFPEDFRRAYTTQGGAVASEDARVASVPEGIFPGYPEEAMGDPSDRSRAWRLDPARADWSHPVVRKFKESELAAARFFRVFRFHELDATAVPLRFDDGSPALLERAFGTGRVIVFASACDADWGEMMTTGSTAALALSAVYYASGRGRNDALNRTVGDDLRLRFPFDLVDREVTIARPSGTETRVMTRASRQGEALAGLPDAKEAGLYRFQVKDGPSGAVAVNFDARESDRAEIDPSEIAGALPDANVTVEEEDLLAEGRSLGADAWLVLVLAALGVLCVEEWLANRNR